VSKRALLLIAVILLGCLPQWLIPDWHGTEGRRIQIALEMLRSGDWLVPTLGGEPTWAKPPLHYWVLAAMSQWLGPTHWALRLPSVLSVLVAAFAALALLRPWFGERAGWTVAFGIACSPLVLYEWPTAEIDPPFAALTALSIWCLATGVARDRAALVVASGVLGGLALLQKGPPYFLFAAGAYIVWWRRRGFRHGLAHFVPLLAMPALWLAPLFLLRVAPDEMAAVAGDESVGRLLSFSWQHFTEIPGFWLRAVTIQLPFVLWCFWEWRGARDARMDAADLTLRMCSGAAVLAIVLLTFFPGRPTRYILPNVMLFTFAVGPAVAHFAAQQRDLGAFSQRAMRAVGLLGAGTLLAIPFVPRIGLAAAAPALAFAVAPLLVRTPRALVCFCLAVPVLASWTVGWERSLQWPESRRAREAAGQLLRRELEERSIVTADGATPHLVWHGHIEAPLLLAADILPDGQEMHRKAPTLRWVLHERGDKPPPRLDDYAERLRICVPGQIFVLRERSAAPR
jgi:4-amino-4-deoxy-L-arabinose transferase-like glycosyltransferase